MKILRLNYNMMDHVHFTKKQKKEKKKKTVRRKQQITTIWKIKAKPSSIGVWNKLWKDASMIFFCLISRDCGTFFWVVVEAHYSNLKWGGGGSYKATLFSDKIRKAKAPSVPCAVPAKFVLSSSLFRYLFTHFSKLAFFFLIFKEKVPVKIINKLFSISRKKRHKNINIVLCSVIKYLQWYWLYMASFFSLFTYLHVCIFTP